MEEQFRRLDINAATGDLLWKCPYCRDPSTFGFRQVMDYSYRVPAGDEGGRRGSQERHTLGVIFQCRKCNEPLFMRSVGDSSDWKTQVREFQFWPAEVVAVSADIPAPIRDSFREALLCRSVGAWNAVGTMCRRALEEVCVRRGARGSNLPEQINSLAKLESLPAGLVESLQRLRIFGRDGAHADGLDSGKQFQSLTADDATDAIDFCDVLLDRIFTYEAKVAAAMAKRPR